LARIAFGGSESDRANPAAGPARRQSKHERQSAYSVKKDFATDEWISALKCFGFYCAALRIARRQRAASRHAASEPARPDRWRETSEFGGDRFIPEPNAAFL
jgi:hypothetical protein